MEDHIKVMPNRYMPRGCCLVRVDGIAVYAGEIGRNMIPFITPDALLILHPDDFADGEAFFKHSMQPN
jgi:hypothetical protein